jgi:hypothetical protein
MTDSLPPIRKDAFPQWWHDPANWKKWQGLPLLYRVGIYEVSDLKKMHIEADRSAVGVPLPVDRSGRFVALAIVIFEQDDPGGEQTAVLPYLGIPDGARLLTARVWQWGKLQPALALYRRESHDEIREEIRLEGLQRVGTLAVATELLSHLRWIKRLSPRGRKRDSDGSWRIRCQLVRDFETLLHKCKGAQIAAWHAWPPSMGRRPSLRTIFRWRDECRKRGLV